MGELLTLYLWEVKQYWQYEVWFNLGYFFCALVLLLIAKIARDWTTRGVDDDREITEKDNAAFGLYSAGYYIGVGFVLAAAFWGESASFTQGVREIFQYGITGIVLMGMSYTLTDRIYLRRDKVMEMLVQGNTAVASFIAGRFVFTGLIAMASIHGEGTWFLTFVTYILGELGCWLGFKAYTIVTPYDDLREMEVGKTAVGLTSAGFLAALGIITCKALWGDFLGYDVLLVKYVGWLVGGTFLLLFFRSVAGRILFPKSSLVGEIHRDNNRGAACIMASAYLILAAIIIVSF